LKENSYNKNEIKKLLDSPPKDIALITHINPDGDAIGSSLALFHLLKNAGHNPCIIAPNAYPEFLHWLPGNNNVLIDVENKNIVKEKISDAQIIFGIDFNDLGRIYKLGEQVMHSQAYKVIIDHHPFPGSVANCIITDTNVSSTAELIYRFIVDVKLQKFINKDVAVCIFTGMMADTGCFSYNSSNRDTYLTIARLLEYGFDKDFIYYNLYDNFSAERMRLLGYSLNEKMEVFPEYKTAMISLKQEELKRYNFQPGDSESFVNYPLSIKNIRFSAIFIEKKDYVKASFRSKGNFAVHEFAKKHFNGGGHLNAAGGESYMTMDETLKLFRNLLPEYKEKLLKDEI
jgi:phosphoesterase RecJ-like protein